MLYDCPKLKPNRSPRCVVQAIKLFGCLHVKLAEKFPQSLRIARRGCNEVVMDRKNRPSPQVPAKFVRILEQRFLKEIQPTRRLEMRQFPISICRDNVKAGLEEPVSWRVRPIHGRNV